MLKRQSSAESDGKLPHLSIPSKTATWVPEFAAEDLPLGRTAALIPEFAVKDLPLGWILCWWWWWWWWWWWEMINVERKICVLAGIWTSDLQFYALETIRSLRHTTYTSSETNPSFIHISIQNPRNLIAYYITILTESNSTSGDFVWIYFIY